MRRLVVSTILALATLLVSVVPARGSTNTIRADITKPDAGHVNCGGKNTVPSAVQTLGVSYVCQRRVSGQWQDIGTAPASTCGDCSSIGFIYTTISCADVGNGSWTIRAQADGWHVHYNGTRHDAAAVATTATKTLNC